MLEAGSRPAHSRWWGLHSKRDNGSLVACHSRDMAVELEVERWSRSHPSRKIYIVGHFSLDTQLCEQHLSVIFTSGYFCLGGGGERVRCFCLGICEGSCINRTWEVGGPRLSLQKLS